MKVEIELTDEQVEWAKSRGDRFQAQYDPHGIYAAIVAALPKPSLRLRERAYRVVYREKDPDVNNWRTEISAIADMARWLYDNAGEREWYVGSYVGSRFCASIGSSVVTEKVFDSMVDAYAHVVVGLGEAK